LHEAGPLSFIRDAVAIRGRFMARFRKTLLEASVQRGLMKTKEIYGLQQNRLANK
jgi:hypothetical protein